MSESPEKSASPQANKRLDKHEPVQRSEDRIWPIASAALLVGRDVKTIWNALSEHASRFDEPLYDKIHAGRGNQRMFRVLSNHDLAELRMLFPLYRRKSRVKRKEA